MTFYDYRLSQRVEAGFSGGPEWNTLVVPMASGAERRRANWAMPHHRFTADYAILDPRQKNEILAAFWAMRGQLHSMRFKDWNDYRLIDEVIGVGAGTNAPMQLIKTYTFGPASYVRAIRLPLAATLLVTSNGTPKAVTVDPLTGLVTPTTAWTNGAQIRARCEFDVRVRFGKDHYPFTQQASNFSTCTIDLMEDWN